MSIIIASFTFEPIVKSPENVLAMLGHFSATANKEYSCSRWFYSERENFPFVCCLWLVNDDTHSSDRLHVLVERGFHRLVDPATYAMVERQANDVLAEEFVRLKAFLLTINELERMPDINDSVMYSAFELRGDVQHLRSIISQNLRSKIRGV